MRLEPGFTTIDVESAARTFIYQSREFTARIEVRPYVAARGIFYQQFSLRKSGRSRSDDKSAAAYDGQS
jgi:hypothetical protein